MALASTFKRRLWLLVCFVLLAGCGGSTTPAGSGQAGTVNTAAAQALVAPYTGQTGPFPITHPLITRPAPGTTYALLQCATPVCALFSQLFAGAAKAMGVQLTVVKAAPGVTALQAAMSTIIAMKPAGVIVPGISGDSTQAQLRELAAMHIPVVSLGVVNASQYGISFDTAANPDNSVLNGKLMAAWAVLQKGANTNAVFYATPELSFSQYMQQGFDQEIKFLCPACQVRNVVVPAATIGNTAPSLVVSDLQAHPKTNVAVFATEEAATGLPAALATANLSVIVTGYAPPPAILQYIKAGQITSGLAADLPVSVWETVDALARLSTNQPLVDAELKGGRIQQFLGQNDINFDPAKGWTGYPDFPQRFAQLWK